MLLNVVYLMRKSIKELAYISRFGYNYYCFS